MATAPHDILVSLTKADLLQIAQQEGLKVDIKDNKSKLLEAICLEIEDIGIKQITAQMKKVELEEITEPLNIDHGKNSITKTVLRKRLVEIMEKEGPEEFFKKHTKVDSLISIIKALNVDPVSTSSKEKLVIQATTLVNLTGFQTFFGRFDTNFLQHIMEQLNLKCETDSKPKIVYALATQSAAKKENRQKEDVSYSKKKLAIRKGISYQDIYQHYLKDELVSFCRENEMKVTGSKKEVINRILAYLDGDKENTMANNVSKSPKKADQKPKKRK